MAAWEEEGRVRSASRLLQAAAVMLVVSMIAFIMFRFAGDPVSMMIRRTQRGRACGVREALGLDDPWPVQYARFLGRVVQGISASFRTQRPVLELIGERLPATVELVWRRPFSP